MTLKNFIKKKLPKCIHGVTSFKVFEQDGVEVIDDPLFTEKEWDAETFDKKWLKAEVVNYSIGFCTGFYEVVHIFVYDPDKPVEGRPYYFYMDSCGDGVSTGSGWVKLTPEQARIVDYALTKSNWKDFIPGVPMVDGDTRIHLDKWKTVKQVEGKKEMRVYVVERHFRDRLVIPFAVNLLELFENRETGLEFCEEFIKNSKQNSKKDEINIVTEKTNTDKDLICNSHVANFEFLCGYWKEVKA